MLFTQTCKYAHVQNYASCVLCYDKRVFAELQMNSKTKNVLFSDGTAALCVRAVIGLRCNYHICNSRNQ